MPKHRTAASRPQHPFHAKHLLTPLPATLAALGLLLALPGGVPSARAATPTLATAPPLADQDAATADLVQRLVLDRAASLARVQRKADEREQQLLDQLEGKDRTLRRALKEAQAGDRQTAQLRADLAGVTAERARLVEELTRRDSVFKGELAEYRRLVAELANSPNPERRQALERYADGDRVGAFATLKELTRIEEAAGEKAVKLRAAARYREQAALAADMKDRGDPGVTTLTVLVEWEAAAERDSGDFATWGYISRLRHEAGQTGRAIEAARELQWVATTDRERSVALNEMGDLLLPAGDLPGARRSFEESLQVDRRLAAANPTSAQAQRDVSVSLNKLGDVQVAAGDLPGARRSFEDSLQVARRLAAANPISAQAQRDVVVSLVKLARIPDSGVRWSDALREMQSMKDRGVLAPRDERFLEALRKIVAAEK
jgi:tetratricopeptide (TPR) repeat protein